MAFEIIIPEVGESIREVILAEWYKKDGEYVNKDETILVIETEKVTLEIPAGESGVLTIGVAAGETVAIGAVVGAIQPAEKGEGPEQRTGEETSTTSHGKKDEDKEAPSSSPAVEPPEATAQDTPKPSIPVIGTDVEGTMLMPAVRRLVSEKNVDIANITGSGPGGLITKGDVILYLETESMKEKEGRTSGPDRPEAPVKGDDTESVVRKPMSSIRKRIAENLLAAKQNTAMLTTFNEIDMSRAMAMREDFKTAFEKRYQVRLGFMSFFIKATVAALKEMGDMNARIDGNDIVHYHHYHIGVAIGAEKGLVVPVIRHADQKSFADLEQEIVGFVEKIKTNRLTLSDMAGGTFTITNGGVYGSLLSTPILNMPQSGILGMHKIEKRPIVVEDEIVIRPMMYVALSYDHRIVDGKTAVVFLRRIKEFMEHPERMLMEI